MTGFYIAISSIVVFLFIDHFLRYGKEARSLKISKPDSGTSILLRLSIGFAIALILSSYFLNKNNLFQIDSRLCFVLGIVLVVSGCIIKIIATITLKEFYTRTLKIVASHTLVQHGIYSIIRHPGYLGIMALLIGAGLLTSNLIAIILIILIVLYSFIKRLLAEEKMLIANFGGAYEAYMQKTYRLVPFLF